MHRGRSSLSLQDSLHWVGPRLHPALPALAQSAWITTQNYSSKQTARVKTYGDVISDYDFHPEAKCADSKGNVCGKQTIGLLQRRHISIGEIIPIGKESNSLEEVDAGLIHSEENVYTVYSDPRTDNWERTIKSTLKTITNAVLKRETGLSLRTLQYARNGPGRPNRRNQLLIVAALKRLGLVWNQPELRISDREEEFPWMIPKLFTAA
jgi:hypothetical protein